MDRVRLEAIRIIDLLDHFLLRHRFGGLCGRIAMSPWWGERNTWKWFWRYLYGPDKFWRG